MPKHMLYDSVEEANNRLVSTVVTYEGRPVFVHSVEAHADGVMRVQISEFPFRDAPTRKKINSPAFRRFQTPPLGFANYFAPGSRHAAFCERTPNRQRQQGLSGATFAGSSLTGAQVRWDRFYTSDAFREMIADEYPSFEDARGRLVPDSSIAVDREFALMSTPEAYVQLFYRRDSVGLVLRDRLYLRPDRRHMAEAIAENPRLPDVIDYL